MIVRLVRVKMEEHKIDQEIDFVIQREPRSSVLRTQAEDEKPARERGRFAGRLKRVG